MGLGTRAVELEEVVGKDLRALENRAGACGLDVGGTRVAEWGWNGGLGGELGVCESDMGIIAGIVT